GISSRGPDPRELLAAHIARIAPTLSVGARPRLERLRGFGPGIGRNLTCACSRIVLPDETTAILVAAIERSGPDLPLGERVARLLAGGEEPIAAFTPGGSLIAATESAQGLLNGARSLAALGVQDIVPAALASGHAAGSCAASAISIDRIGGDAATVLIASFVTPAAATELVAAFAAASPLGEPAALASHPSRQPPCPAPAASRERRGPLRFLWQMDDEGRFTLGGDEFIALSGPRAATLIGRPWSEVAGELGLDPDGQIARAVATRDTWSGLSVSWPFGVERIAVELSGLPVFDRDRIFRGYRGFGVCRDVARLAALKPQHQPSFAAAGTPAAPPIAASVLPASGGRSSLAAATTAENVVPFPNAAPDPRTPALSAVERGAFHELSRKLAQRLANAGVAPRSSGDDATELPGRGLIAGRRAAAGADEAPVRTPAPAVSAPALVKLDLGQAEFAEFAPILDTATDGVLLLDRLGRIVFATRGAEALFGYEVSELIGRAFRELFDPDSVEEADECFNGLLAGRAGCSCKDGREVIGRPRQGGPLQLLMTMGRIGEGADSLCAAFRDISEWKRAEERLAQAKRQAERTSSAKSDFLARVSHEMRAPLDAIIGFSEVMMEGRFGPVGNEHYREYLRDIHASGGHLLALIDDLLDLSKIEAGKLELTFANVSLNDLARQCVVSMRPQANREHVVIRTSLPPTLPQVVADAARCGGSCSGSCPTPSSARLPAGR
ncbi:MAG: histidine kinase dimerization/phospho-acceptor domain-containing protein, partial [Xanthobacteraceae bacterium]